MFTDLIEIKNQIVIIAKKNSNDKVTHISHRKIITKCKVNEEYPNTKEKQVTMTPYCHHIHMSHHNH